MRWARKHKVLAALLPGLSLVLAAGITVGTLGAGRPGGARPPGGGPAAALAAGPATRGARWLAGPAGRLLEAVNADLGRLSAAERAGQPAAARIAGMRLSRAAQAAAAGPTPPVAARTYRLALRELDRAGRYAAGGTVGPAGASLKAGEAGLTKVTAAVDSLTVVIPLPPR